ncbi:hypothetical protein [Algoriphagus algorifonticola]|uniref:hypothetical protein n=1 Tax=Algoriphagus algorifonticola TaxID=2593007 RepID=UPI0011A85F31|nr:hypothetical protein [Algoriphagus algorifonticola]
MILPFFEKEPEWEDFYTYQFPDGRQVFEVHLKNLTGIMPTAFMEKYGSQADDLTEESLLFVENPQVADGFIPVVARYFSEGQKSEGMTYHQIPLGWTGRIDLFTYDERHLRSIKVENGQLISHIRYQTKEPKVSSRAYSLFTNCQPGYWVDFPYFAMEEEVGVESQQSVWVQECYVNLYETNEPVGTETPSSGGGGTSSPPPPTGDSDKEEDICEEEFCIPFPEELLDPDQKREAQLDYLNTHGASEFVSMIRQMMTTPGLTMGDWAEINKLVNQIYLQQKGKFMMAIFSPENVSQVLFLALSTNISDALRNRVFSLSTRYSAYTEIASMLGSKSWTVGGLKITFNGYTSHAPIAYGISKGLSPSQIKTILGNGVPRIVHNARWGNQLFVEFQGKAIVIDISSGKNHGKIVTYLLNP